MTAAELADRASAAAHHVIVTLRKFCDNELKRLGSVKGEQQDVLPPGQRRSLLALDQLGGSGNLAEVTTQVSADHGDANKSTVLQALNGLVKRDFAHKLGGGFTLTRTGSSLASALAEIERSAKSYSVSSLRGGRSRLTALIKEHDGWNTRLERLLSHADSQTASPARVYDYMIGGSFNFVVDRMAAVRAEKIMPWVRLTALLNRAFLYEAVSRLAQEGIRQFIDVGAGLPTTLNTHDIVSQYCDDWRVVYVDSDSAVVDIGKSLLEGDQKQARYVRGSFETLAGMFDDEAFKIIKWSEPIALVLVAVLHFSAVDRVVSAAMDAICEALPKGSKLVLSHGWHDKNMSAEDRQRVEDVVTSYYKATQINVRMRSKEEIARLLQTHWTPCEGGELDFVPHLCRRWEGKNEFLRKALELDGAERFQSSPETSLLVATVQTRR